MAELDPTVLTVTLNGAVDVATQVERLEPVRKLRCAAPRRNAGGGGINVARVVCRLGGRAQALFLAGGAVGEQLKRLVGPEGVATTPVAIADETRESFTVFDKATGEEYRFVLPGPTISEAERTRALQTLRDLPPSPWLVVSGSLPPGIAPDCLGEIAELARSRGQKLVVDASGPALAAALKAGVWMAKPNLVELSDLIGRPLADTADQIAACRGLIETGRADVLAVSLGERGALLVTREAAWSAPALPIELVSSVGAGDSFVGAMVWALAAGRPLVEAFAYGVAAGSAALLTPGTELCEPESVRRLFGQVRPSALDATGRPIC